MGSLRLRLLVASSVLLAVFFGIAIAVLDNAFRDAAMRSAEERLDILLFALLAAAEPPDDGRPTLTMPADLQEPRFGTPGSGLYGAIYDGDGLPVWTSRSTLDRVVPWTTGIPIGSRRLDRLTLADETPLLSYSLAVDWEFPDTRIRPFTFHVGETLDAYNAQVSAFRRQLFAWFAAVAVALLISLALLLSRLLRPLSRIEAEIHAIEQGETDELSAGYPSELAGVQRNLNALIRRERSRGEVYRRTLGDLAHSLKTPLATLKTLLGNSREAQAQLDRMDELVRYQLAKPATRGRLIGARPFAVREKLESLADSFAKIYFDKGVAFELDAAAALMFRGDSGDFLELAGNLMDNAYKRCKARVRVSASRNDAGEFVLTVDDDGPGFPEDAGNTVLDRGRRLDEAESSQGIGLSIVADICELYGATLRLGRSPLGGARVDVRVPNP